MIKCQFYKTAIGGGVGRIVGALSAPPFPDRDAFVSWAQIELPARRADPDIWLWPEAVRAVDESGAELFRWTIWDQAQAGKPLTNAAAQVTPAFDKPDHNPL
ncbi:hypothetical protein [Methylocystis parvus]|uniref:hypothetical protein n=1 Tax=Methylocystis parvus TaxID=134 RepID=UPI003C7696FC